MRGFEHFDAVDRVQIDAMLDEIRAGRDSVYRLRLLLAESREQHHRVARKQVARGGEWALMYGGTLALARRKIRGICAVLRTLKNER